MRWLSFALLLVLALPAVADEPAPAAREEGLADLMRAYEKEYAFLEAEKQALTKRLSEVSSEAKRREARAEASIASLQERLVELRGRADDLEVKLQAADRDSEAAPDTGALSDMLARARETLEKLGAGDIGAPSGDIDAELAAVRAAFVAGASAIERGGRIVREPGSFFLHDGTRTDGTLVRVGRIATYGVSEAGSGALAPAGAGYLKLWPHASAGAARALAEGEALPPRMPIFLYESLERSIDPKAAKTPLTIVEAGGPIAWVIVGLGAAALLLVVLRALILLLSLSNTSRVLRRAAPHIRRGRYSQAAAAVGRARGAAARVMHVTISHLHLGREALENVVAEAILREAPRVGRFGQVLTVMAAVAPLLGLLGTVTGMIATFDVITEHGTGDPKMLSGGISEALITTELGLIVAIPTLLLGTLLQGAAAAIQRSMERAALRVINLADSGDDEPDDEQPARAEDGIAMPVGEGA
jgi:biopolymer transport protein ExbB